MNREIKFRGKRMDNGEWVNGYLANSGHQINPHIEFWWIAQNRYDYGTIFDERSCDDTFIWHRVEPNTIGQYTGLKDKNGKEIYEGDIVDAVFEEDGVIIRNRAQVVFDNGCWGIKWQEFKTTDYLYDDIEWLEVIGNIFDNPELLEAKI